ncbi:MAG: hypothetical protein ACI8S6_003380 [Myxococcota bacterium]|jgi:hypothetical protein
MRHAKPLRRLLLLSLLLTVGAAPPEPNMQRGSIRLRSAPTERAVLEGPTTPLSGRLLYEDRRRTGQHQRREDLRGDPGLRRPVRTAQQQHYLGALYMVVDVYERDPPRSRGPGCVPLQWVGTATVQGDGSFVVDVPTEDPCTSPGDPAPRHVLRARAGYCDEEMCFQIGPGRESTYELWFELQIASGGVGVLLFSPEGKPDQNNWSRASNHYASLVDTIVSLHVEAGIPFRLDEHGPLQVRFPSLRSDGWAASAGLIEANNEGWPRGGLMSHEYGHIVHRRAWGGDYGGHANPIQSWSGRSGSVEEPFIAFKEGWANFIGRYVSGRCERPASDTSHVLPSLTRRAAGNRFPENHQRALCDWVDSSFDRRDGVYGGGDELSESIYALWQALDQTDDTRAEYDSNDPVGVGLDICDVARSLLSVQKSAARIGEAEHAKYTWQLSSLLENNDLSCRGVPRPETLLSDALSISIQLGPRSEPATLVVGNPDPVVWSRSALLDVVQGDQRLLSGLLVPSLPAGGRIQYPLWPVTAGGLLRVQRAEADSDGEIPPITWAPRP